MGWTLRDAMKEPYAFFQLAVEAHIEKMKKQKEEQENSQKQMHQSHKQSMRGQRPPKYRYSKSNNKLR